MAVLCSSGRQKTSNNQHFKCSFTLQLRLLSRAASMWLYWTSLAETTELCRSRSSVGKSSETASLLFQLTLSHHLLLHHKWTPRLVQQLGCSSMLSLWVSVHEEGVWSMQARLDSKWVGFQLSQKVTPAVRGGFVFFFFKTLFKSSALTLKFGSAEWKGKKLTVCWQT